MRDERGVSRTLEILLGIAGALLVAGIGAKVCRDEFWDNERGKLIATQKEEKVVKREVPEINFPSQVQELIQKARYEVSREGLDLIKSFEGFESEAYLCPAGVWTIGYGHTRGVKKGDIITEQEAEKRLKEDVKKAEDAVNKYVHVQLTQNQYDALVSFVYNVGEGNFENSTLLKKLNSGDYNGVRNEFGRWVYASGKRLRGLEKRRVKEKALFSS